MIIHHIPGEPLGLYGYWTVGRLASVTYFIGSSRFDESPVYTSGVLKFIFPVNQNIDTNGHNLF